jgi:hypothetical protein
MKLELQSLAELSEARAKANQLVMRDIRRLSHNVLTSNSDKELNDES